MVNRKPQLGAAIFGAMLCCAAPATARDGQAYAQAAAGLTDPFDSEIRINGVDDANRADWHTGQFDLSLAGGYDFGHIRVEGEAMFLRSRIHDYYVRQPTMLTGPGITLPGKYPDVKGWGDRVAVMANVIAETGGNDRPGVYAGLGVGIQHLRAHGWRSRISQPDFLNGSDTRLAWQALAGARVPITRHIEAGVKYRFIIGEGYEFTSIQGRQRFRSNFGSHSWLATLGWNF